MSQLRSVAAALAVATLGLAACTSSAPDADEVPGGSTSADVVADEGDVFTPGDSESDDAADSGSGRDPSETEPSADESFTPSDGSGATTPVDDDATTSDDAQSSANESDVSTSGDGGGADPASDPVTELTPDEIIEAGPIDDETRNVIDEAEEEFRNRPDAEPGELALANADFVFETRYIDGDFIGTVGTVDVPLGSMIAYSVVTDVDDDLVLVGSDVSEPTNADSAQILFIADTLGELTIALEDSGTELLRIVVA